MNDARPMSALCPAAGSTRPSSGWSDRLVSLAGISWTVAVVPVRHRMPPHALLVGVSRPGPACEGQCQLKRFG